MTYTFIVNGETRLLLVPSNEAERLLMAQLIEGDVEVHQVSDKVNILGQSISGGVIIRKKNTYPEPKEMTVNVEVPELTGSDS